MSYHFPPKGGYGNSAVLWSDWILLDDKELEQLRAEYLEAIAKWNDRLTPKERLELLAQIGEVEKKLADLLFKRKPS
jgi:hypothetical protein